MRSREIVILVISLICLMVVAGQVLPPPSKYKFPLHLTEDGSFYTLNVDVANNETFRLKIDTDNYLLMLISNETCPSSFKGKCLETVSDWRQNTGFKYCSNCTYFQQQYCRMGISKVRLELENGSSFENGEYFFCVANYLESKFGEWRGIDGTIGLINPVKDSEISSFYSLFPSSTKKLFALELYNDQTNNLARDASVVGRSSSLSIGGYDFKSENESQLLRWSESGKWKEDYLNVFPFALYHLSICGVDLMEGISSEMTAVISTNVECVHLPENLWKMVMSWIEARCDSELQYPPIQPRCNLTVEEGKLGELPPLIFKLSEFGEDLHLPLQLLLQPTSTKNTYNVCLKISEYGQIIIGTRVLQNSFTTLFDLEQRKVGLIPIHNYSFEGKSTFSLCASPLTCSVTDTYDAQYNLCFPPNCSSYLFQVNGNHGDCVYSKIFVYPLLLVLFSFCSIEVVLAVIYRKMTDKMSIPFLHD